MKWLSIEPLIGPMPDLLLHDIDWVVVGGESGRHGRPLRREWIDDIQTACARRGIPFFFKQWGRLHNNPDKDDPTAKKNGGAAKGGMHIDGQTCTSFPVWDIGAERRRKTVGGHPTPSHKARTNGGKAVSKKRKRKTAESTASGNKGLANECGDTAGEPTRLEWVIGTTLANAVSVTNTPFCTGADGSNGLLEVDLSKVVSIVVERTSAMMLEDTIDVLDEALTLLVQRERHPAYTVEPDEELQKLRDGLAEERGLTAQQARWMIRRNNSIRRK